MVIDERSYELSPRGKTGDKFIDCVVPYAPPVYMIRLLQEQEITLMGDPDEDR
jgi:hypothetical protein